MEEIKKLYTQRVISIATFFGGPIAAVIMIRANYKNLGKQLEGRYTLIIGIISTAIFLGLAILMPETKLVDSLWKIVPILYVGAIYLIVDKFQGQELKTHKESNGKFHSNWRAAGIGLISLLVVFIVAFLAGDLMKSEPDYDAASYDSGLSVFVENEENSLEVFNLIETSSRRALVEKFTEGGILWQENKQIIHDLNKIENLPSELILRNEKLLKYCELRIEYFEYFAKANTEGTDNYDLLIDDVGEKIDNLIEEIQ